MTRNLARATLLAAFALPQPSGQAAETAVLKEVVRPGNTSTALVEMTAQGTYTPQVPEGAPTPKPLDLRVETRFDLMERVLKADEAGGATRVARRVTQAASAINGKVRPQQSSIRPEVALLVSTRRDGTIETFSPGGPLTRSELELVQAPGDPLSLADLLPAREVGVGDTWPIRSEAAKALSGYDALASNSLKAKVELLDADTARMKLAGEVRGAENGAEGSITFDGAFTFDRKAGRVDRLKVERQEVRRGGPVGAGGLDIKSTLTVARASATLPAELSDEALAGVPTEPTADRLLLSFVAPDGSYSFLHDRAWHIYWDDARMAVLKRLDHGEVIAQCNLSVGPDAGPGRHQDPKQFQEDVRKALGARFVAFLGRGELEGAEPGGYRFKLTAQGRERELDVIWHYYLIAKADGRQVLATFTLSADAQKRLGDQDGPMIGSLQWRPGPGEARK